MMILLNLLGRTLLNRRRALWGMALVAPNVIGLMFFFGLPALNTFLTSLVEWNGIKPLLMIGSLLATLPMLIIFVVLHRYFVEGVALSGLKR